MIFYPQTAKIDHSGKTGMSIDHLVKVGVSMQIESAPQAFSPSSSVEGRREFIFTSLKITTLLGIV